MAEQVLSHTVHPHPQPGGSLLAKLLEVLHRWTQDGDLSNEGVLQEFLTGPLPWTRRAAVLQIPSQQRAGGDMVPVCSDILGW